MEQKTELLGLNFQDLTSLVERYGQPGYRAKQIFSGVYRERLGSVRDMSSLPQSFRDLLAEEQIGIGIPKIQKRFVSVDGTVRYLVEFSDGQTVETVWMPQGDDGEEGDGSDAGGGEFSFHRATICVSSQAGCAVNCQFCMTALLGAIRNLTAGEVVGQIVAVLNDHGVDVAKSRVNLVFMGQGEPFLNYDNFMKSVHLLVEGVGIPVSRMTVSTSGIVPRIHEFAKEEVRPKLAISLNASNDETREKIMPINRKWKIADLLDAAKKFPLSARERLTFEYVLLEEVNDFPENARELARLVSGIRCKVNLIAFNPGPEMQFRMPSEQSVDEFRQVLKSAGVPVFVRRPRGRDIYAACGQLRRMI